MPLWLWILLAWLGGSVLFCLGWWRFFREIRDWEDERAERFGIF